MCDIEPDTSYTVTVAEDQAGCRRDRAVADALPALSRTRLKALIESGRVARGGAPVADPARKVAAGDVLAVSVPPPVAADPRPQALPLVVVYEDAWLIVVDKPAGLVVHPAAGHAEGTLVNALLAHCGGSLSGIGGVTRPGIVHRLDKDTSGLIVVAKTDSAHQSLAEQFHDHTIERAYAAVVWGVPRPAEGRIEGNIGRDPRHRKRMAVVERGGKPALTHYRTVGPAGPRATLVRCRLATGRTHQIRVHMSAIGHPVVGDPLYGGGPGRRLKGASEAARQAVLALQGQALHAYVIGFSHPETRKWLRFESDVPSFFNSLCNTLNCD
jgi:23S rRNA pseudouridine1911/1915/1917 synthase